jgi:hypothetical protein
MAGRVSKAKLSGAWNRYNWNDGMMEYWNDAISEESPPSPKVGRISLTPTFRWVVASRLGIRTLLRV